MNKLLLAHLALFCVNVLYGANYIVAKGLMPDVLGPSIFILFRVSGAVLLFLALKFFIKEKVEKKDLKRLAVAGLFGVAVNQLFFFNGLNLTSPINSAIIMTSNPVVVLLLAALIIKEKITRTKLAGVSIGMIGAIALIILSSQDKSMSSNPVGDLFILINSISYATYLVVVKPLMAKYKPITVISYVFLFGLIYVLPFGLYQLDTVQWQLFNASTIASLLFVIVGVTFLAYLFNIFALKVVSPTVTSSYIYLQPVMAGIFAFIFSSQGGTNYAQDITGMKLLCTLLIFTGVYLVSKRSYSKAS